MAPGDSGYHSHCSLEKTVLRLSGAENKGLGHEGQTGDLVRTGPHGDPLLLPMCFDFVGVWELGA